LTFREVAAAAYFPGTGAPLPAEIEPGLEATHHYDPPPATFANGAHLAVVDVDIETGEVVLVRYLVRGGRR
jgi:carbon-monoxide dehydrogenase large subunit